MKIFDGSKVAGIKTISLLILVFLMFCQCKKKETLVSEMKIKEIKEEKAHVSQPEETINKDFILGKFDYKTDSSFAVVDQKYTSKTIYLKKVVIDSFIKMATAANNENVQLKIISGTRNFDEQKIIWERKWLIYKDLEPLQRAKKILEYSSMPSTSRHHWGTDIDINNLNNQYFQEGKGLEEYNWLNENAHKFGFYQVYTNEPTRTGYHLEMWHYTFLPLSKQYLKYYNEHITTEDIVGFEGCELASSLNIIKDYVNGINAKIK